MYEYNILDQDLKDYVIGFVYQYGYKIILDIFINENYIQNVSISIISFTCSLVN